MIPPRSLSMSVSFFFLPALLLASFIISSIALASNGGILPSFFISCAMNWMSSSLFFSLSSITDSMYTSYPYPLILDLSAGCIFWMSCRLPAATSTKSHGAGSVLTRAPELISLCPVIEHFFSCIDVRSSCWALGSRLAISSM